MAPTETRVDVPESSGPVARTIALLVGLVLAGAYAAAAGPGLDVGGPGMQARSVGDVLVAFFFALAVVPMLAFPFHEIVHAVALWCCGVPWNDIELHWTSVNAPGARLTRRRYRAVLAAPYPFLLLAAVLSAHHPGTFLVGLPLVFLMPLTAIKDTRRAVGIRRANAGLLWEDVPGASVGHAAEPQDPTE